MVIQSIKFHTRAIFPCVRRVFTTVVHYCAVKKKLRSKRTNTIFKAETEIHADYVSDIKIKKNRVYGTI